MSETKQILKVSKDSLLAVVSSVIPVNETVTLFFRKLKEEDTVKTLIVDEKDQAKVLGVKGIYKDITLDLIQELNINSLRFDISKLSKWLPLVTGDILVSTDGANITFTLADNPDRNITSPLIQEVEREPKIALVPYPAYFKVNYSDLESAKNELVIVGETLEIDVSDTIKLSCSSEGSKIKTPLNILTKKEGDTLVPDKLITPEQYGKYVYSYSLFESALKGLSPFPEVKVNFGRKENQIYPLVLEASTEKVEIKYGISPRLEK